MASGAGEGADDGTAIAGDVDEAAHDGESLAMGGGATIHVEEAAGVVGGDKGVRLFWLS